MTRITIQHLQYLVALVEERHVTRAADKAGIGQPAMSAALAKLRTVFKDPILVRTTSGMAPTERALELARRAHDSIDLLSGAEQRPEQFSPATVEGHFRFMASEGVSDVFIPAFMSRVRKLAPKLRFTVSPGDIRRASDYLKDGQIEFVTGYFRESPQELYQAPLYKQRLVCIAAKDHPSIQTHVNFDQFIDHGHVVWGALPVPYPTFEMMVDDILEQRGKSRQVALRVASMSSTASVVALTDLIAVVPERIALGKDAPLPLQILALPFPVDEVTVTLLWHERWHRDPVHTWLRTILRDVAIELR